jgi:hypothetical protein
MVYPSIKVRGQAAGQQAPANRPHRLEESASTSQQRIADADDKTELSATSAGRRRIGRNGPINQNKKNKPLIYPQHNKGNS